MVRLYWYLKLSRVVVSTGVLSEGKELWKACFALTNVRSVRDELKLNRADVGWYQIRKTVQARNASGDFVPVSF
ncbi:MAG: hypothetical protein ABIT08_05300 [Bacteroidia bacterium]